MKPQATLRHFLATLAYRGTNVLQNMPAEAETLRPHPAVRTPVEILNHINGVLTYAHSFFVQYDSTRLPLADWDTETDRFFEIMKRLDPLAFPRRIAQGGWGNAVAARAIGRRHAASRSNRNFSPHSGLAG